MRPVLHGDVVAAACYLLTIPETVRRGAMTRLLDQAEMADRFRVKVGRLHPFWGDGSLEAAARKHPVTCEPFLDDPRYVECLVLVFQCLLVRATKETTTIRP